MDIDNKNYVEWPVSPVFELFEEKFMQPMLTAVPENTYILLLLVTDKT